MESKTTKIKEIVSEPPHTIEDAVPNPAANIPPNLVPLIDEVPSDSLSEPLPEPIGKIQVNENMYNILDLIFSTQGLVGHGTVCYLVRKDEEEYIVKDRWVLGSKSEVLNEICMMEKMDGIHGVPRLVEYWLVEMEPSMVDETVKYHQKYGVGGMGTVPFMSWSLLFQLHLHTLDPSNEHLGTCTSGSKSYPPPMVTHVYQDDLKSMFYVFIWVCIKFRGPLGMKHVLPTILPQYSLQHIKWIMQEWSVSMYQKYGDSKTQFFHQSEHYTKELSQQFDPYFESLLPLALEWYDLVKNPDWLLFDNIIDLLGRHIAALPKEDSTGLLVFKWVILSAAGSLTPPWNDEESASPPVDETQQK
ncbi:hypothetical protein BDR06DRAFT_969822 [Suillus hirtellus]|nr:hypothetical protein BDR06DRAFT_969822 [Suillus hirtellus]